MELTTEERQALMIKDFGGRSGRDGRICICGHPMAYHHGADEDPYLAAAGLSTKPSCRPLSMDCPCEEARAVILTRNTRAFLYKTTGNTPAEHALRQGITNANKKHARTEWFVPLACDRCEQESTVENRVNPVGISPLGRISAEPAAVNKLLCRECRELFR